VAQKKLLHQKLKSMARKSKGKLIVFEGIDGSGKTTQVTLLLKYLISGKIAFSHYSFPRYEMPWGKMVRRYLDGEFGNVGEVDPYLASVLYTGDRLSASDDIRADLASGKIVICDRYIASNIAHQATKLKVKSEKLKFIQWIEQFEYEDNKIPREDLVVLLSLPPAISQKLMSKKKKDIHERDENYLIEVGGVYEQLGREKKNWVKVDCLKNGKLKKPERIFGEVLEILRKREIL